MGGVSKAESQNSENQKGEEASDHHDLGVLRVIGEVDGNCEFGEEEAHPLVRLKLVYENEGRVDDESEFCPEPLHREAERSNESSGQVEHLEH